MGFSSAKTRSEENSWNYEGESIETLLNIVDETLSERNEAHICVLQLSESK